MNKYKFRNGICILLISLFLSACNKEAANPNEVSELDPDVKSEPSKLPISKYDELLTKANSGDLESQFELAEMLNAGDGIPENDAEAFRWYESAARGKHPKAILALSNAYLMPDTSEPWLNDNDLANNLYLFVQQDKQKAISMVEDLAATGNQEAISAAYWSNDGNLKSLYWLKLGATQGIKGLRTNLALAYVSGEIVPKDLVLARAWMHLELNPKNRYESMFGEETPEQISLAVELAEKWKPGYDLVRLPDSTYDVVSFAKISNEKNATKAVAEVEVFAVNELMMQSVRCHVNGDALLNTSTGNLITDAELVKYSRQGDDKGMCQVKIAPKGVHWEPCFEDYSGLRSNSDGRNIDKKEVIESRKSGSQDDGWNGDCLLKDK